MSIISGFNKVKNYVKTTEGYKLLSRWTSSDTVDVNGKTLTEVVNELGTASKKDVATSGNASVSQVVMGNDTRLTDARKASDVYSWAKASTKPTYTASEVGAYTKSETDTKLNSKINTSLKGSANGLAELDSNGKVPSTQLPSFVDDVIEGYLSSGKFYKESAHTTQISGESGKIYIDLSTEKTYRWSGSAFVVISETLALGETSSTAYRGDRGKTAYDHSQSTHARIDATKVEKSYTNGNIKINGTETTVYTHPSGTNPHGTTKSDVGLGNVGNFKAVSTVANQGLSDTEKSNARSNIGAQVAGSYASSTHNHDDKYQSKGSYASASHTHDDRYYTESEINTKLNGKANSSHTHGNGDITSLDASKITSGTISIDRLPQGALERLTIVADDTARFKLTSATIQKGDTVKVTSTGKMYYVVDETKLSTEAGYEVYAAGTAASVPWSGVTGKPSTYTPSSHTHTKSQITDFPTSMPANGGNANTVNSHTVKSDVPENAVFTDTVYDDTGVQKRISDNGYGAVAGGKNLAKSYKSSEIADKYYVALEADVKLKPSTTYTISFIGTKNNLIYVNENIFNNPVINISCTGERQSVTITTLPTPSGLDSQFKIIFKNYIGNTVIPNFTDVQIEEGSIATDYEPYFPSNKMLEEEKADKSETTVNLLKPTLETITQDGVTCTNNGDGTYTLNGTATEFTSITVAIITDLSNKRIVGCPSGGSKSTYSIYAINISNWGNQQYDYGNGVNVSSEFSKDIKWEIRIGIGSGYTCNNLVFKPMLTTNLDATYDDFVPYTGDTGKLNSDVANIIKLQSTLGGKVDSSIYSSDSINLGRKTGTEVGKNSFACGNNVEASGSYSHAEGYYTKAVGKNSHAEGDGTKAIGNSSHAEGYGTTASGNYSHAECNSTAEGDSSHAEGCYATASGAYSHAEGYGTTASGNYSHAEGVRTTALINQHAQGHCNNTTTATANDFNGISNGTAFVIGNGTTSSASNAFRVTGEGKIYATNASVNTGADYAEYFEWSDGNPNNEDRVGYFVTFDNDNPEKIKLANSSDDYILGIVSGMPSIIGNGDEDWKKRYILDDFGRYIKEEFEYEIEEPTEELDEEGNIIFNTVKKTGTKWKENPDYDNTKEYTPRDQRQEWSAIGMLGVLSVYDDGTCEVNGFCKVSNGGIATKSEDKNDYRVISRLKDNIVRVVFR